MEDTLAEGNDYGLSIGSILWFTGYLMVLWWWWWWSSLINDMFRGQQRYVTTCCSCHTQSTRLEAFCELEVNIDKDTDKTKTPAGEGAATTGGTKSKSTPSVTDCIAVSSLYTALGR